MKDNLQTVIESKHNRGGIYGFCCMRYLSKFLQKHATGIL